EPDHGSDVAGGMETTATKTANGWIIHGEKRWIGRGTSADFALVWARDTDTENVKGFLVLMDLPGVSAEKISDKIGLRVIQNADIVFDNVELSDADALPGAAEFSAANEMLRNSRIWVGWQAYGAQMHAFDVARDYVLGRKQFGQPLAKFQLVQRDLAEMISNAMASFGLMQQVARLQAEGRVQMVHAAMAKSTGSRMLRDSAARARNMLGGNGIVSTYEAAKIFTDAEIVHTYEGTYEINSLIVARAITGMSSTVSLGINMEMQGQAAIVSGSASGLGATTAKAVAAKGMKVCAFDLAQGNEQAPPVDNVEYLEVNVTDHDSIRTAMSHIAGGSEPLRVVINCAGIGTPGRILSKKGPHDLDQFA